jgi:hypothetical protein
MPTARDYPSFLLNLGHTGGDIVPYRVNGGPAFLINHPMYAREVLVTHEDRYHNPYHPYRELTAFYAPTGAVLLGVRRDVQRDRAVRREIALELTDTSTRTIMNVLDSPAAEPLGLDRLIKGMMFTSITHLLFGIDASELADPFVEAASLAEEYGMTDCSSVGSPDCLGRRYGDTSAVQIHTAEAIARRTRMIHAHERISSDRAAAIVRTLLNSYNATATALIWLLLQLAQHEDVLEGVHHEIDGVIGTCRPEPGHMRQLPYTRSVVMEALRLFPPAWAFGRVAKAEHRVGDTLVPAGAVMSVSPYTLQRDARFWRSPSTFRPERFTSDQPEPNTGYAYLPFGGGTRRCPAAALNVGSILIIVTSILRLARIEVTNHQPIKPRGLVALRTEPPVMARLVARR